MFVKIQAPKFSPEDSRREDAMTESSTSSLRSVARDILISQSHEELSTIINHLFMRQETEEYKFANSLYVFFISDFVNLFSVKLLNVYQWSSNSVVRFRSIYLLSDTLIKLRNRNSGFYRVIKPLLVSCLTMEVTKESDVKIFARIVSIVANNVGGWNELSDCILSLVDKEPVKAFHVFVGLPVVPILEQVLHKMLAEAIKMINPDQDRAEYWRLALETVAKSGIFLTDSELRYKLIGVVLKSAKSIVAQGKEQFLERGLEDLKKFLARDSYSTVQLFFVGSLAFQIAGVCCKTFEKGTKIATEIIKIIENPEKYRKSDIGLGFERDWYEYLKNLSSLELFRIFASTDLEDRSRELAIRRLNVLLNKTKDHLPSDPISVLLQLQTMIISCLEGEGYSESMFKVLGEVVNNVMCHMITREGKLWDGKGLFDYIVSKSKTRFQRAVYIFQCFTMKIENNSFVVPVMNNLLPEISSNLNPPSDESLLENSLWVLAFTGAFCAVIRLIDWTAYDGAVKEIAYKMVDSVRELVERGMEVGVVRRGFRELESLVKKQLEWYDMSEYKFVKSLLWKLYAIKGMRWESKIVLWRINLILERGVSKDNKELPRRNHKHDWINQEEDEEADEEE